MKKWRRLVSPWRGPFGENKTAHGSTTTKKVGGQTHPVIPQHATEGEKGMGMLVVGAESGAPQCNGTGTVPGVVVNAPHPSERGDGVAVPRSQPGPSQDVRVTAAIEPKGDEHSCSTSKRSSSSRSPAVGGGKQLSLGLHGPHAGAAADTPGCNGSSRPMDESVSESDEECDDSVASSTSSASAEVPVAAIKGSVAHLRQMLLRPKPGLGGPPAAGDATFAGGRFLPLQRKASGTAPQERLVSTLQASRSAPSPHDSHNAEMKSPRSAGPEERTRRVVMLSSPAKSIAASPHFPVAVPIVPEGRNGDSVGGRAAPKPPLSQPSSSFSRTVDGSGTLVDGTPTTASTSARRNAYCDAAADKKGDDVLTASQSMHSGDAKADESDSMKATRRITSKPVRTSQAPSGAEHAGRHHRAAEASNMDTEHHGDPLGMNGNGELSGILQVSSYRSRSKSDGVPSSSRDSENSSITNLTDTRIVPREHHLRSAGAKISTSPQRLRRKENVTAAMLAESCGALGIRDDELSDGSSILTDKKAVAHGLPGTVNVAPAREHLTDILHGTAGTGSRGARKHDGQHRESVDSLPYRLDPRDRRVEAEMLRLNSRLEWEAMSPSTGIRNRMRGDRPPSQHHAASPVALDALPPPGDAGAPHMLPPGSLAPLATVNVLVPVVPLVTAAPLPRWILPSAPQCHDPHSVTGSCVRSTVAPNPSADSSSSYSSRRANRIFSWIPLVEGDSSSDDSFFGGGRSCSTNGPTGALWGLHAACIPASTLAASRGALRSDTLVVPLLSPCMGDAEGVMQDSSTATYQSSLMTDTFFVAVSKEAQLLREVPEGQSEHCILTTWGALSPGSYVPPAAPQSQPQPIALVAFAGGNGHTEDPLKAGVTTPNSGGCMSAESTSVTVTSAAKQDSGALEENSDAPNLTESGESISSLRNKTSTESVTVSFHSPIAPQSSEHTGADAAAASKDPKSLNVNELPEGSASIDPFGSESLNTQTYLSSTIHPEQVDEAGPRLMKARRNHNPPLPAEDQHEETDCSGLSTTRASSRHSFPSSISQTRHPSAITDDAAAFAGSEACATRPCNVPGLALPPCSAPLIPPLRGLCQPHPEALPPLRGPSVMKPASADQGAENHTVMPTGTRTLAPQQVVERTKGASHPRAHGEGRSTDSGCSSVLTLNFSPHLRRSTEQGGAPGYKDRMSTHEPRQGPPASRSLNLADSEPPKGVVRETHEAGAVARPDAEDSMLVSYVDDGSGFLHPVMGKNRKNVKERIPDPCPKQGGRSILAPVDKVPVAAPQVVPVPMSPTGEHGCPAPGNSGDGNDGWGLPAFVKPSEPRKQPAPGRPAAPPATASPNPKQGALAKMLQKRAAEPPEERRLARSINSLPEQVLTPWNPPCVSEHPLPAPPKRMGTTPRAPPPSQDPVAPDPADGAVVASGPTPAPIAVTATEEARRTHDAPGSTKEVAVACPPAVCEAKDTEQVVQHAEDVEELQRTQHASMPQLTSVLQLTACEPNQPTHVTLKRPKPPLQRQLRHQVARLPDSPKPEATRLRTETHTMNLTLIPSERKPGVETRALPPWREAALAAAMVVPSVTPRSAADGASSHAVADATVGEGDRGGLQLGHQVHRYPSDVLEDICMDYWGYHMVSASDSEGGEGGESRELPPTPSLTASRPSAAPTSSPDARQAASAPGDPTSVGAKEPAPALRTRPPSARVADGSFNAELDQLLGGPWQDVGGSEKPDGVPSTPRICSSGTPRSRSSSVGVLHHPTAAPAGPGLVHGHSYHCSPRGQATNVAPPMEHQVPSPSLARRLDAPPLHQPLPAFASHVPGWSGLPGDTPTGSGAALSPCRPNSLLPQFAELWVTPTCSTRSAKNLECLYHGEQTAPSFRGRSLTSPSFPTGLGLPDASCSTLSWLGSRSASRCCHGEGGPSSPPPPQRDRGGGAPDDLSHSSSLYTNSFRSLQLLCDLNLAAPSQTPLDKEPSLSCPSSTDWSALLYSTFMGSNYLNTPLLGGGAEESPLLPAGQPEKPPPSFGTVWSDASGPTREVSVTLPPAYVDRPEMTATVDQESDSHRLSAYGASLAYDYGEDFLVLSVFATDAASASTLSHPPPSRGSGTG